MKKTCPVCKKEFDCYPDDIQKCHCSKVALTMIAKQYLSKHYKDCLCIDCLKNVAEKAKIPDSLG